MASGLTPTAVHAAKSTMTSIVQLDKLRLGQATALAQGLGVAKGCSQDPNPKSVKPPGPWLASNMTVAGAPAPCCAHHQAEGCQPGNTAGANSTGTWTLEVSLRSGPCGQKPTMKEIPSRCTFSNKSPSHLAFLRFAGIALWTICTKPQHHQHSGNEKKKVRTPSSLGRLEVRGDGEGAGQWGMRYWKVLGTRPGHPSHSRRSRRPSGAGTGEASG